jgi:hypothetical protein
MKSFAPLHRPGSVASSFIGLATALALFCAAGCTSGVAPSKTTSGALTGGGVGALGGAVIGNNSSLGTGTGAALGAVAGAAVGAVVGLVQEAKEHKEQDRLAQERSYQQELARRKSREAALKAEMDEELAIAQGFRISDMELADAQKKKDDTDEKLKHLREERSGALNRKKTLDELHEKQLQNEGEIAKLEEELTRLKGDVPLAASTANPPPPAKPGI